MDVIPSSSRQGRKRLRNEDGWKNKRDEITKRQRRLYTTYKGVEKIWLRNCQYQLFHVRGTECGKPRMSLQTFL